MDQDVYKIAQILFAGMIFVTRQSVRFPVLSPNVQILVPHTLLSILNSLNSPTPSLTSLITTLLDTPSHITQTDPSSPNSHNSHKVVPSPSPSTHFSVEMAA